MKDLCRHCAYAHRYKSKFSSEAASGYSDTYGKCHCMKANSRYNKPGWTRWMTIRRKQEACEFFLPKTGGSVL